MRARLINFMANAREPQRKELVLLQQELNPDVKTFKEVYGPVRHRYFAHRSTATEDVIAELFSKTNFNEAAEILKFVYDLICGIQSMAWNGTPPGQWSHGHYERLYRQDERSAESFMRGLLPSQTTP